TGSFRPTTGTRHLHRDYSFTGSLEETVPKSLRHSCRSELRVNPPFPEAQTIPSPWRSHELCCLTLNSRLWNQGPASDRVRRFGPKPRNTISRPFGRSVVTGSTPKSDFPRDYPFAATASLTRRVRRGLPRY